MWDKDRHALDNFWNCSAALEVFVWTLRDVIFQETVEPPCELWKLGTLLWYEIAWPMYTYKHLTLGFKLSISKYEGKDRIYKEDSNCV